MAPTQQEPDVNPKLNPKDPKRQSIPTARKKGKDPIDNSQQSRKRKKSEIQQTSDEEVSRHPKKVKQATSTSKKSKAFIAAERGKRANVKSDSDSSKSDEGSGPEVIDGMSESSDSGEEIEVSDEAELAEKMKSWIAPVYDFYDSIPDIKYINGHHAGKKFVGTKIQVMQMRQKV
ncbi:hypothetical protein K435DRAFT_874246 [Dendrothele bispora CBS 962.96]|uniref:Uncharacterized protein n=1 Tax=Dendrothele bispora (strain CBS 962.96) TaxID=1314807 RepID=A0A4S8KYA1_DENBC|nr:hypothetical protein K435DRAFT_874246 [Dendrothele bispora CBS 962.96]